MPCADDQLEGDMPEFNSEGSTSSGPAGMGARSAPYTGSYIVLLDPRSQKAGLTALRTGAGLGEAQSASAFDVAGTAEALASDESVVFKGIGVAVVGAEPDQRQALARTAAESPNVLAVEREPVVYAFDALSSDYLRGGSTAIHAGEVVFRP